MMFFLILILKPHSRIMKVPNLLKRAENQSGWAREKPINEHHEIELSRFESRLSNRYLWIIRCEIILAAPMNIFNKMSR